MYALQTIQRMNSKTVERQQAQSAILAEFVFHSCLSRRLRAASPETADQRLQLAKSVYRDNPDLRFRMDQVAPWFLMLAGGMP